MEVEIRPMFFTEADLAAADQLVQLSVSGEAASPPWTSSSSSSLSVNNKDTAADVDDGVPWVDRRAKKRYRLVAELYDATRPVSGGADGRSEAITAGFERRRR